MLIDSLSGFSLNIQAALRPNSSHTSPFHSSYQRSVSQSFQLPMRLRLLSLCSLFVILLSFHSFFVVVAVPLAINEPSLARRGGGGLPMAILLLEVLERTSGYAYWRIRFTLRTLMEPVPDNGEWTFMPSQISSHPVSSAFELGTFEFIQNEHRNQVKVDIEKLRAKTPEALLAALMEFVFPEFGSTDELGSTSRLELPIGAKFRRPDGGNPEVPNSDAWAVYRDSRTLTSSEFEDKYGCECEKWVRALGYQGKMLQEQAEKEKAAKKAAEEKAAEEKAAEEKAAEEKAAEEKAAKERARSQFNQKYSQPIVHQKE
ncbi:hypothetical protein FB446DRAFT_419147 [Lentinula raphanica]|nr:hypothetical protein FB446DRAFT_419147 [Lentinula raphanica]